MLCVAAKAMIKIMKLYINKSTDPYFNLAAEEYLIKNAEDDVIVLWRNSPSVIIGKNQNAFAEINFDFVNKHGIKVVRRLTGGGAVFHDFGNLNYTFISAKNGQLSTGIQVGGLDFAYFTRPIISALSELSLDASLSGRNDIVVKTKGEERKISGNAQCVIDGVTLHHGTLLFSSELSRLADSLNVDPTKLKSKGIASVRSRVVNIYDLLTSENRSIVPDVEAFCEFLAKRLSEEFGVACESLPEGYIDEISRLAQSKYAHSEWNIGKFGNFSTAFGKRFDYGLVEVRFSVFEGRIKEIEFGGDFFGEEDVSELAERLIGVEYTREAVFEALSGSSVQRYIAGATPLDITDLLISVTSVS